MAKEEKSLTSQHSFDPFSELRRAMDDAMSDFYTTFMAPVLGRSSENRNLFPSMDLVETDHQFSIELEMPGMAEENIDISIDDNRLIIKGEKTTSEKHSDKDFLSREIRYGSYARSIDLPSSADTEKATASFKKGILCIKIPKKDIVKPSTKKLKIKTDE